MKVDTLRKLKVDAAESQDHLATALLDNGIT
ncbi:MAG: hypothetical protein ACI9G1_003932 [Pirellulaceae bacterium]|jgi:hypothetical protein